jgi:hypothetical protein
VPRCKGWVTLNPPGEFEDHAAAVAREFLDAGLVNSVEDVDVVYGYGPSAQVSFTVAELDRATNAALVDVAERLRRGGTRAEFLAVEVWLTPQERDAAEGGGTLAAYDAPYRHDQPE